MIFFAIPFFRNVGYLNDALTSLLGQSSGNWVALVLDDAHDENESSRAEQCVAEISDARIRYIKNSATVGMANNWNQGLAHGRNHPQAIATSILHADDRLRTGYVKAMLNAIENNPAATAFFCRVMIIDENGKEKFSFADFYKSLILPVRKNGLLTLSGVEGIRSLVPGNYIFCPTLCYRNSLMTRQFDPGLKMVPDLELILSLLLDGHQLQGLYAEALFEYRRHSASTTNIMSESLERFKEEKALYENLANQLETRNYIQLGRQTRKLKVIRNNLLFLATRSLILGRFALAQRYFSFLFCLR